MINFLAKIRGSKEYNQIRLPGCWEECSTEMFQRIGREWDGEDQLKLFCIMSGHDFDAIRESKSKNLEYTFWHAIKFVFDEKFEWSKLMPPQVLKVAGKTIDVPKKLGRLSLGQHIAVAQAIRRVDDGNSPDVLKWMSQTGFPYDELMAYTIAVYIQPLIDGGSFDDERASAIEREIMAMPITRVYAIGFFLLMQVSKSGNSTAKRWSLRNLIRALNPFHTDSN